MCAGQYRAYKESVSFRTRVLQRRITCRLPTERSQAMDGSDERARDDFLRTFILLVGFLGKSSKVHVRLRDLMRPNKGCPEISAYKAEEGR